MIPPATADPPEPGRALSPRIEPTRVASGAGVPVTPFHAAKPSKSSTTASGPAAVDHADRAASMPDMAWPDVSIRTVAA